MRTSGKLQSFTEFLIEGMMSSISILARDANDFDEFVKLVQQDTPHIRMTNDVKKWLKEVYDEVKSWDTIGFHK